MRANREIECMKRRQLIAGMAAAAGYSFLAVPTLRAQPSPLPVIGFLSSRSPAESAGVSAGFRQGLGEVVVGQNVAIEYRWAEGNYERLPALAAELSVERAREVT